MLTAPCKDAEPQRPLAIYSSLCSAETQNRIAIEILFKKTLVFQNFQNFDFFKNILEILEKKSFSKKSTFGFFQKFQNIQNIFEKM